MHRFLLPAIAAVALAGCSTKASQSDLAQIYIGSPQVTEWHEGVLVQAIESKTTSDVVDLAGQALPTHGVLGGVGAVINAASLVSSGAVYSYQFHLKKPDGNVAVLPHRIHEENEFHRGRHVQGLLCRQPQDQVAC